LARALGVSLADLFLRTETAQSQNFYVANQKGEFTFEFPHLGYRVVSYIPFSEDLFIGKVVMSSRAKIGADALPLEGRVFISVMLGKLDCLIGKQVVHLKEGAHVLLNARISHAFHNPQVRDCSFLLITVPSFLSFTKKKLR